MKERITHIVLVIYAAVLLLLAAACQPTPEQPVVVNQNHDLVAEVQSAAQQMSSETAPPCYLAKLELPEHYTYNSVNEAASLTINVDADVLKPECDQMPFARVTPMNFTQQMVTGMFNYLFPDDKPYLPREQFTQSEIAEQILHYQNQIANGFDGEPLSEEDIAYFEERITELEEQYPTAPVEIPDPVICDGTLQFMETTGNSITHDAEGNIQETEVTRRYYEMEAHLDETFLHIFVSADESDSGSSLWYVNTNTSFSTDGMVRVSEGDALPEAAREKLTLSLAEAIVQADGFFEAAGIDDVVLFASYLVDNHGTGHVDDNYDPASDYAYKLFYTHTVGGVAVSCHESHGASGGEYSEPWFYESIQFLISDDGILEINWDEPCTVSEIIEEDVKLIDFDTAMAAFESAVGYTFGQYLDWGEDVDVTVDVEIDNIQLNLIRLREKDRPMEKAGIYVPAYVFYGYVKQTTVYENEDYTYEGYMTSDGGGNDFYPGPLMVIAINAIDGSIINTMADVN